MGGLLKDKEHPFIIWANKARILGIYDELTDGMVIGYSKRNGKIYYSIINYSGKASKLVLPPVDKIGDKAFKDCESLIEVEFDPNIKETGIDAFNNCVNLEYVDMENTDITIIQKRTFSNCINLKEIKLPKGLRVLEETALNLGKITVLKLPETLEVMMAYALNGGLMSELEIPKSVVLMDYYCINNNFNKLRTIRVRSNKLKAEHRIENKTYSIDLNRFKQNNVNLIVAPSADIIVNRNIEKEFKMLSRNKALGNIMNFNKSITFVDM